MMNGKMNIKEQSVINSKPSSKYVCPNCGYISFRVIQCPVCGKMLKKKKA